MPVVQAWIHPHGRALRASNATIAQLLPRPEPLAAPRPPVSPANPRVPTSPMAGNPGWPPPPSRPPRRRSPSFEARSPPGLLPRPGPIDALVHDRLADSALTLRGSSEAAPPADSYPLVSRLKKGRGFAARDPRVRRGASHDMGHDTSRYRNGTRPPACTRSHSPTHRYQRPSPVTPSSTTRAVPPSSTTRPTSSHRSRSRDR